MTTDTPPKSTRIQPPTARDRAPRQSSGRKKSLTKPLTEFFTTIGTVVYALNPTDGAAILNGAENLATALNAVAKDNATVYANLQRMITGSTWGGVFVAAGAIALPIMANHNLLPFDIPGLTPASNPTTNDAVTESTPPPSASVPPDYDVPPIG